MGRRVGYFALDGEPRALFLTQFDEWFTAGTSSSELDVAEFVRQLSDAQEDLTPERQEFLRLVIFGTAEEWEVRIRQVHAFADRLTSGPIHDAQRERDIEQLRDGAPLDLLVVGGAWSARASRWTPPRADFAWGSSSAAT